jgi:glycosyltransferase involved in cell wall biosynthesis
MIQAKGARGRVAWCVTPILSGVTTVYRVVGGGLRRAGWEVVAVTGEAGAADAVDAKFAVDHLHVLEPASLDVRAVAAEFVRWVVERGIDVVFCTGQMFTIAAAPALPRHVRLITRVANMTRRGYELAAANLSRVNTVVVETPRQYQDMVRGWKVDPKRCVIIPGGIELETYSPGTLRDPRGRLRLIHLGRLDDNQKGVMLLPRIARQLVAAGVQFHLDIIGDGPDRDRLAEAFARAHLNAQVTFHGSMRREEALPFLQRAHLFLLPSRYEGVPWALLETMACGCVPIVSRIAGTTDFVVDHGVNGVLCMVGKASAFAHAIVDLAGDRKRLESLSAAASQTVRERFSVERVVRDHEILLETLLAQEPLVQTPIPVSEIQIPKLSAPTWRRFVPQSVKNYVRTWAERFHRSV